MVWVRDLRFVEGRDLTETTKRKDEMLRVHVLLDQRLCHISRPVREDGLESEPESSPPDVSSVHRVLAAASGA